MQSLYKVSIHKSFWIKALDGIIALTTIYK